MNATSEPITDDDILVDQLDFDPACECDWDDSGKCENPAAWLGRCMHCRDAKLTCEPCRIRHVSIFESTRPDSIRCPACGHTEKQLDHLIEWVPIGGHE